MYMSGTTTSIIVRLALRFGRRGPSCRSCRAIALAAAFFPKGAVRARRFAPGRLVVFLRISEAGPKFDCPMDIRFAAWHAS